MVLIIGIHIKGKPQHTRYYSRIRSNDGMPTMTPFSVEHIEIVYTRFCKERFPLPSEGEIIRLEESMGIPFPPDYRNYLLCYNGGFFAEPPIHVDSKRFPSDSLSVMAGIKATHHSAELCAPQGFTPAIFDGNDPPQIIPIGYTTMGNLIFVVSEPSADDCGEIAVKLASSDETFWLGNGIEEFFSTIGR